MIEKEFLKKIIDLDFSIYTKKNEDEKTTYWAKSNRSPFYLAKKTVLDTLKNYFIYTSWVSGGRSGGSCWDEGEPNYYPVDTEKEEDLEALDIILREICPNLSFLDYKTIIPLIEYDSFTQNEYYGNFTTYSYKYLNLKSLYNKLKEIKAI